MFCALAATAVLGGCASVETRPVATVAASNPIVAQAQHLARNHASLSGTERSENERQIERCSASSTTPPSAAKPTR